MKKSEEIKEVIEEIKSTEDPDWKDMYVRLYADMDNLKKRMNKEKEEYVLKTKIQMINSILDVDNDLNIALKSFTDVPKGVSLIISKIKNFLESQGIQEIETSTYNKDLHEVISVIETGNGEKIVDVIAKGYRTGDKVIRYPKIILSK